MTVAIVVLFLAAVVVAVPLGLTAIDSLGDPVADRGFAIVRRTALPAAILLALAFAFPPGIFAGGLALPWLAMTGVAATLGLLAGIRGPRRWRIGTRHAMWAALVFLAIGAGNAISDRLGIQPFGFSPTIVLLTAVHFHVAGFVLVVAGALAHQRTGSILAGAGVAAVIVGMPTTALGFFGVPVANLAGAAVVSLGGLGIAVGALRPTTTFRSPWARRLGWLSGLSLLVAMPLALTYAIGTALGTAWLDLPTMARTHGAINVLGFAIPVSIAMALERRAASIPVRER
jgi:hypothetical protein